MKNMKRNLGLLVLMAGSLTGCAGRAYVAYGGPPPPPPPMASGYVGRAPGPGYVWVDGYYDWRGRYVWVPGSWMRPPRPRAVWVPGRFEHRGRRHEWVRGYWRY